MAEPTTRLELIETVKRRLGHPMVDINITEEQFDDRVDQALRYYYDYHFNGSEKVYFKKAVTQADKDNGYITIPENIIGVIRVFPYGEALSSSNIFSLRYQIALNDLYTLTSESMVPYFSAFQHIELIEEILVGQAPIRYNRHKNLAFLDWHWDAVEVGTFVMLEAYEVVDPDTYTEVWRDRWLIDYTEALSKLQWGNNLKKFGGVPLIGGAQINGQQIFDEAKLEVETLQKEMIETYSIPVNDFVG